MTLTKEELQEWRADALSAMKGPEPDRFLVSEQRLIRLISEYRDLKASVEAFEKRTKLKVES